MIAEHRARRRAALAGPRRSQYVKQMSGRIVLYGATGYTGRLTAQALLARGARPVLAGRDPGRLTAVAARLAQPGVDGAELETAVAGADGPAGIRALIGSGDVLVSTAGPFVRAGAAAVSAAVSAGAVYLDSTGEPPFIRRVFEEFGPQAQRSGAVLLTAFGHDYVPGNLAGALALREAGAGATRVDIGYFARGDMRRGSSAGTRASAAGVMLEPGYAFRDGRLVTQRPAAELRTFHVRGKALDAISVGGTEQFTLPRLRPAGPGGGGAPGALRDVGVYLGWFGPATRTVHRLSAAAPLLRRAPGLQGLIGSQAARIQRSRAEPDPAEPIRVDVVAVASGADGSTLAEVQLSGADPYTFTGSILAWAACRALEGKLATPPGAAGAAGAAAPAGEGAAGAAGTATPAAGDTGTPAGAGSGHLAPRGALGPVEAFGLDELTAGCAEAGLTRA